MTQSSSRSRLMGSRRADRASSPSAPARPAPTARARARGSTGAPGSRNSRCTSTALRVRPSLSLIVSRQLRSRETRRKATDRALEREVLLDEVVLDHAEHDGHGAALQIVGHLAHVGVAHDDVETAVLLGIGVRLVARIDDGARCASSPARPRSRGSRPAGRSDSRSARRLFSAPTLPAPVKTWRVTKNGMRCCTMRAKGTLRSIR